MKRAFRILSLKLHPDKNPEADADLKFRQLVSITEVLKDDNKRKRYHQILEHGLPDWKTGVYYYRRARKLGLMEMSIIVSIILTFGHYLVIFASYYEKVYEVNEIIKKREKRMSRDDFLQFKNDTLINFGAHKPQLLKDNLVTKTALLLYWFIWQLLPHLVSSGVTLIRDKIHEMREARVDSEIDGDSTDDQLMVKKPKPKILLPDFTDEDHVMTADQTDQQDNSCQPNITLSSSMFKSDEWSEDELLILIKLTKKFPGGTVNRWERISEAMGRSLSDVTSKAKGIKTGREKVATEVKQKDVLQQKPVPPVNSELTTRDVVSSQNNETSVSLAVQNWSQEDQLLLEKALLKYPKTDNHDRWIKISSEVPGKSSSECLSRYRWLSDLVKQKKKQQKQLLMSAQHLIPENKI